MCSIYPILSFPLIKGNNSLWVMSKKSCLTQRLRVPEDNSEEEVSIIEILPIALRKKKIVLNIIFLNMHALIISNKYRSFIVVINTTKIHSSIQETMKSENWTQVMREDEYIREKTRHGRFLTNQETKSQRMQMGITLRYYIEKI